MKTQISRLQRMLDQTFKTDIHNLNKDKDAMEETIQQKDREMTELTRVLQRENERGALMESQIRAQEVEIRTLLNCVENLRK